MRPVVQRGERGSRADWASIVDGDADALPEHAPEWLDAMCASGRYAEATRYYDIGGRRFVLPLVRRCGPAGAGGWYESYPYGWGSGGLVGEGVDADVVRTVVDDLRTLRAARVVVRPDPVRAEPWMAARGPGVVVVPRRAHVADLTGGLPAVLGRLPSLTRRNLRVAHRHGVRVEEDRTGRLLPVYRELYRASLTRWAEKQHEPLPLARWRAQRRDPAAKFEAIARHLGERFRLFVAYVDERPAAAVMVLFGNTARYMRGAMDRELAAPSRANDALHLAAIEQACAAGCTRYHFGETGSSESLARFKERFGGVAVHHAEYRIERYPITAIDRGARSAVKKVLHFRDA